MTSVEQSVGHAALSVGGAAHDGSDDTWLRVYLYSRAQSVMGGTSQIQRNLVATPDPRITGRMKAYDVPDEIEVSSDGPIRIIRLNRPEQLNATNHALHKGLAGLFPQLDEDDGARVAVLTGAGRAFSAGGDFTYLDALARDPVLRKETLAHGRQLVTGMVRCRLPIVAAVNGPAVGLGCSLVALSDISYMAESAHLADPHVLIGLVAADGGPVTWPLLISLQLAKEYALTGDQIPARRAAEIGLVNHVCPDDEVMESAMACARRLAALAPTGHGGHQACAQPAPGASGARDTRLRSERRGPVLRLTGAPGQRRPFPDPASEGVVGPSGGVGRLRSQWIMGAPGIAGTAPAQEGHRPRGDSPPELGAPIGVGVVADPHVVARLLDEAECLAAAAHVAVDLEHRLPVRKSPFGAAATRAGKSESR